MALFVISWTDRTPDGSAIRAATREAHLAFLGSHPGVVKVGGPFLDETGAMTGSMLVVDLEDMAAAQAFHEADPYKAAGLFETASIRPWKATVGGLA